MSCCHFVLLVLYAYGMSFLVVMIRAYYPQKRKERKYLSRSTVPREIYYLGYCRAQYCIKFLLLLKVFISTCHVSDDNNPCLLMQSFLKNKSLERIPCQILSRLIVPSFQILGRGYNFCSTSSTL